MPPLEPENPQRTSKIISVEASFTGPIPHPDILRGYEDVCPGAADRLISMAEKYGEHRREMERRSLSLAEAELKSDRNQGYSGLAAATLVSIASIVGGVYVAIKGNPGWGAALSSGGLLGVSGLPAIISAFTRRENKPEPVEEKMPAKVKRRK
jgi:uncharacterized membrane protein